MSKSNPFILKLGSFLPQTAGYSREFSFEQLEIQLADNFLLRQFQGLITATRTQQGLLLRGNFEGKLDLDCVRCLKSYTHLLQWELTEFYVFNHRDANEDDLILPDNAQIDLSDSIEEEAHLDIPINPVCKESCQGLCQTCGADLNLGDCGHEDLPLEESSNEENSPFAGLNIWIIRLFLPSSSRYKRDLHTQYHRSCFQYNAYKDRRLTWKEHQPLSTALPQFCGP